MGDYERKTNREVELMRVLKEINKIFIEEKRMCLSR